MQYFQGKSVYKGIVMGPVAVLKKNDYQVKRARIEDPEAEVKRVKEAVEVSKKQLGRLYDKAVREVGEASAAIFEVHQMMLEDEDYLESMENMIRIELVNAEYAAAATGDNFAEMFAAMDDEYMKARSADVKDISERLVRNLSGEGDNDLSSMEPSIIVADDLSPSETVQMDKEKILAFVTVHGSTNSHTAILARMMNIPALIGVPMDLNSLKTGMMAVVDGFSGQVIFEPEEDVQKETEKRMQEEAEKQKMSIRDLVNMAALVEMEAVFKEEQPRIAGVFLRRLEIYMPIQSDTTIQYILGTQKEEITIADTRIQNPYNTYQNPGLPPGPISSPGMSAIKAVLNPEKTEYLYFVAEKDGHHRFTKTYAEHLKAIEDIHGPQ